MKGRSVKIITAVLFALATAAGTLSCGRPPEASGNGGAPAKSAAEKSAYLPLGARDGLDLVAENGAYALLFEPATASVAVFDKAGGETWRSVADSAQTAGIAEKSVQNEMLSQFVLTFYGTGRRETVFTSYGDSVAKGQYKLFSIKNGVRVEFTLGEKESYNLFPEALSAEYTEGELLGRLPEADKRRFLQYFIKYEYGDTPEVIRDDLLKTYKNFRGTPIYAAKQTPARFRTQITEALKAAGLTAEKLTEDYAKTGYETSLQIMPRFEIPVEYTLTENGLDVRVAYSEIDYRTDIYKITDFRLLPFFGACGRRSDGYMLVPDGSGMLIDLDNPEKDSLLLPVYGAEEDVEQREESITQNVHLPVYGMKKGDSAFLAVIGEGDALAEINASGYGHITALNHVYASFKTWPRASYEPGGLVLGAEFVRYGKAQYGGDIRMKFLFLRGEDADYAGMAAAYRDTLFAGRGRLGGPSPLYVESYGVINCAERILGLTVRPDRAYTTVAELEEMIETLKSAGAESIAVRYKNWSGDVLAGSLYTGGKASEKIGGAKMFKDFLARAEKDGVEIYPDYQVTYAAKDGWFDGFDASKHRAVAMDNSPAVTQYDRYSEDELILLNSAGIRSALEKIGAGDFSRLALSSLGTDLFTDYSKKRYSLREDNKKEIAAAVGALSKKRALMVGGANAYLLPFVKIAADLPMGGSSYRIEDAEVPFLQMALHGYVDYTARPLNMDDDLRTAFLKSVEYGASLCFALGEGDAAMLADSKYRDMRFTGFSDQLEKIKAYYPKYARLAANTRGSVITGHRRLDEDVYETVYENGARVIVNYRQTAYQTGGRSVAAQDYLALEGGGQDALS